MAGSRRSSRLAATSQHTGTIIEANLEPNSFNWCTTAEQSRSGVGDWENRIDDRHDDDAPMLKMKVMEHEHWHRPHRALTLWVWALCRRGGLFCSCNSAWPHTVATKIIGMHVRIGCLGAILWCWWWRVYRAINGEREWRILCTGRRRKKSWKEFIDVTGCSPPLVITIEISQGAWIVYLRFSLWGIPDSKLMCKVKMWEKCPG